MTYELPDNVPEELRNHPNVLALRTEHDEEHHDPDDTCLFCVGVSVYDTLGFPYNFFILAKVSFVPPLGSFRVENLLCSDKFEFRLAQFCG